MQTSPADQPFSELLLLAVRWVLGIFILVMLAAVIRFAVKRFASLHHGNPGRRSLWFASNAGMLAVAWLARGLTNDRLGRLGATLEMALPYFPKDWLTSRLQALGDTCIAALLLLLLLIQTLGAALRISEEILAARRRTLETMQQNGRKGIEVQAVRALALAIRFLRTVALVIIIAGFVPLVLHLFPQTAPLIDSYASSVGEPLGVVVQSIVNYLPNLGYLAVIIALAWIAGRGLFHFFRALGEGSLEINGFPRDWAEPTHRLVRVVLCLFVLMVSYPYLPGAESRFFQGFSLFLGAILTFGSGSAFGNVIAGILLTYTRAFHPNDMVRIGDVYGNVLDRSLLVTRIRTLENQEVSIPNSGVLSGVVTNYSSIGSVDGLCLTVQAGIGYDVDWRTVHRLLLEGARVTANIVAEPAPQVWQTQLGDYAITYELRAYTHSAQQMLSIASELRRNVLDLFNRAGVEIMTPRVLSHRDASSMAIPLEQFPNRPTPQGIAVNVQTSPASTDH